MKFLCKANKACKNKQQFRKLVENASLGEINKLRNLCYKLCHNKLPVSQKTKKKLFPYRKIIRELASTKKLKRVRDLKRKLIHNGGFIQFLLPAALALLSSAGTKLIDKIIPT